MTTPTQTTTEKRAFAGNFEYEIDSDDLRTDEGAPIDFKYKSAASGYESYTTVGGEIVDVSEFTITLVRSDGAEMTIEADPAGYVSDPAVVRTNGRKVGEIESDDYATGFKLERVRSESEVELLNDEEDEEDGDDGDDPEREFSVCTMKDGDEMVRARFDNPSDAYDLIENVREDVGSSRSHYHYVEETTGRETDEDGDGDEDEEPEVVTDGGTDTVHPDFRSGPKLSGELADEFNSVSSKVSSGDRFTIAYDSHMLDGKVTEKAEKHGFRVGTVGPSVIEFIRIDGHHTDPRNDNDGDIRTDGSGRWGYGEAVAERAEGELIPDGGTPMFVCSTCGEEMILAWSRDGNSPPVSETEMFRCKNRHFGKRNYGPDGRLIGVHNIERRGSEGGGMPPGEEHFTGGPPA